jgi:hypothetical protein
LVWRATVGGRAAAGTAKRSSRRLNGGIAQLALILGGAVYVLNVGYGFEGSFARLGRYAFVSRSLAGSAAEGEVGNRFAGSWLGSLPVPLPRNYVLGIDTQKSDFERTWPSYLGGAHRDGGWWYYYLYGLAVKLPVGTWLLVIASAVVRLSGWSRTLGPRGHWREDLFLLVPAVAVLILVSAQTSFSHHVRYAFPILPFVFVWSSSLARAFSAGQRKTAAFVAAAIGWNVISGLAVYPHDLSYFNELAGGPKRGHAHLINSNIDWGQDLLYLKRWLNEHPEARPLKLAYYGPVDPRLAGIEFSLPPTESERCRSGASGRLPSGWYAVSVTFLRGRPFPAPNGRGGRKGIGRDDYGYFLKEFQPVAMAGYSIYIYHVEE